MVRQGLLKPQTNKVEAILKASQTWTKKQLRHFLGLVGYYSHFIPGFATRASPLRDRLGKKQPEKFSWDTKAQGAFKNLQHALVSPPLPSVLVSVLILPSF